MDYKIDWSLRARADLREIAGYIAQDHVAAALAWGNDLFSHIKVLTSFPSIGPAVPEATAPNTRRIVFGDYLVFYRIRSQAKVVEIITVWHGARGLPDFL